VMELTIAPISPRCSHCENTKMPNPLSIARCAADRIITNPYEQVHLALRADPYELRMLPPS
jgi:hypothetical protein